MTRVCLKTELMLLIEFPLEANKSRIDFPIRNFMFFVLPELNIFSCCVILKINFLQTYMYINMLTLFVE